MSRKGSPDAEEFTDRRRHCFFGDRATHLVRRVDLVNKRTACDRWVWDKASKSLPRSTKITCAACAEAVATPSEHPVGGEETSVPPCQSPTCDMNLSACICGTPFGEETAT